MQIDPQAVPVGHAASGARSGGTSLLVESDGTSICVSTAMSDVTSIPGVASMLMSIATSDAASTTAASDTSTGLASGQAHESNEPDGAQVCTPLTPPPQAHATTSPGVQRLTVASEEHAAMRKRKTDVRFNRVLTIAGVDTAARERPDSESDGRGRGAAVGAGSISESTAIVAPAEQPAGRRNRANVQISRRDCRRS